MANTKEKSPVTTEQPEETEFDKSLKRIYELGKSHANELAINEINMKLTAIESTLQKIAEHFSIEL